MFNENDLVNHLYFDLIIRESNSCFIHICDQFHFAKLDNVQYLNDRLLEKKTQVWSFTYMYIVLIRLQRLVAFWITLLSPVEFKDFEKQHFNKMCIYIHMYKGFLFLQHITLVKFLWSKKLLKSLTVGLGRSPIDARFYQSFLLFKVLHTLMCLNARDLWWKHKKTRGPWTTSLTWETSSNHWIHLSKAMINKIGSVVFGRRL